jgi:GH24 family phage-related lysozyme (muramidase)
MKISAVGQKGISLIKRFEGFKAKPYICSGGAKTIGYGATYYPNGLRVTLSDKARNRLIRFAVMTLIKTNLMRWFHSLIMWVSML